MTTSEKADRALNFHQNALFLNPNLASIAVVEKINDSGEPTGDYIIEARVYDRDTQDTAVSTLSANAKYSEVVPLILPIPMQEGDKAITLSEEYVEVIVEESDEIKALAFTDRRRPCAGGNSVGIASRRSAGTLGAPVTVNGQSGYFLSNWHVIHSGAGGSGSPLTQPGPLDGGRLPNDRIGSLHWWALNSALDAAIGKADRIGDLRAGTRCYGRINGTQRAQTGMNVKKCGRTTESTQGVIRSVNASVRVSGYPSGTRLFTNQIQMSFMLRPGDSGSILINSQNNNAVGLCFAGSNSVSFANHIGSVGSLAAEGTSIDADGAIVSSEPSIIEFV